MNKPNTTVHDNHVRTEAAVKTLQRADFDIKKLSMIFATSAAGCRCHDQAH